jgi:hypothetical protein
MQQRPLRFLWNGVGAAPARAVVAATGGNTITVNPVVVRPSARRLSATQRDGDRSGIPRLADFDVSEDELNLGPMPQLEWSGFDADPGPGSAVYGPFTAGLTTTESTGGNTGRINNFESAGLLQNLPANGLAYSVGTFTATAPVRYRVGQAFFVVNAGANDGTGNIFSGIFAPGDKFIIGDGSGTILPASDLVLGTATVVIPEPGTVSLLGLGLVGLILAGRRSRRS